MDAETIRNLITAGAGLVGALIGSVSGVWAEAVRINQEKKGKLENLRKALYKELVFDYQVLSKFDSAFQGEGKLLTDYLTRFGLRTEYYRYVMQNELTLFYQLRESNEISGLQANSIALMTSLDSLEVHEVDTSNVGLYVLFSNLSVAFRDYFAGAFYDGNLDKKLLKRIVTPTVYQEIMKKGKEVSEA